MLKRLFLRCLLVNNRPMIRPASRYPTSQGDVSIRHKRTWIRSATITLAVTTAFAVVCAGGALAQQSSNPDTANGAPDLGGPSSVRAQIRADQAAAKAMGRVLPSLPAGAWLEREFGLTLGADYNALVQHASASPGEEDATAGVTRLYGEWKPFNRNAANASTLVFKLENRHRLGTAIAPGQLGPEIGYAGITGVGFSAAGSLLTNLYWYQRFPENRFAFAAGIVDVTDYVDVYGLVNSRTDFLNKAFLTDPTIPTPDQGVGTRARYLTDKNFYVLGGVADANGDPSDPGSAIDSLVNTHELFKHIEVGWIGSFEKRLSENIHVTAWQVDAREVAQVDDGWGIAFSFSRELYDRWMPFFRAGYSDGGGAILERSVSVGLGYQVNVRNDYLGLGANWGRPPEEATAGQSEDQYTFEAYYRIQALPELAITPDVQFIVNPALDPSEESLWILGLRVRAVL